MHPVPATRNPWPIAIPACFVVFVAITAGLVAFSASQRVELVSPDYYEQELKYQAQIERMDRARQASGEGAVAYDPQRQQISIRLPGEPAGRKPAGQVRLYRPSSARLDRTLELEVDATGGQVLDARALEPGLWRVRVSWAVEGKEFFLEQCVVVRRKAS